MPLYHYINPLQNWAPLSIFGEGPGGEVSIKPLRLTVFIFLVEFAFAFCNE